MRVPRTETKDGVDDEQIRKISHLLKRRKKMQQLKEKIHGKELEVKEDTRNMDFRSAGLDDPYGW